MRLVFSSRCSILPFRLVFCPCVLLVVDAGGGDVVRGASHVDSILSWVSRLVPRFVSSSCSRPVPFVLLDYCGGEAARVGCGVGVLVVM